MGETGILVPLSKRAVIGEGGRDEASRSGREVRVETPYRQESAVFDAHVSFCC